jgi:hypothetical protein
MIKVAIIIFIWCQKGVDYLIVYNSPSLCTYTLSHYKGWINKIVVQGGWYD